MLNLKLVQNNKKLAEQTNEKMTNFAINDYRSGLSQEVTPCH
jgi:hypothetical protein